MRHGKQIRASAAALLGMGLLAACGGGLNEDAQRFADMCVAEDFPMNWDGDNGCTCMARAFQRDLSPEGLTTIVNLFEEMRPVIRAEGFDGAFIYQPRFQARLEALESEGLKEDTFERCAPD